MLCMQQRMTRGIEDEAVTSGKESNRQNFSRAFFLTYLQAKNLDETMQYPVDKSMRFL